MPRGQLSKNDMLSKVYKLKNLLHSRQGKYFYYNEEQYRSANEALNDVLNIIGEYSQ